ncbi:hypothetical protein ASG11_17755 [Sphingomonas sp. Leaf357]|uniref:hypothetical protein n=1 Tax=Sphingomonas sp. Leaf357 TaxID=1736350 RepID=UPI000700DC1E|nr:hypothetical protein [Sphingomonas sp. Leaf357]KQS01499.1 hypothetical protein ASG11_17755 [Sphingomonas sp. Leaf357]
MALKFLNIAKIIAGRKIVDPETGNPTTEFMRQLNDQFTNIQSAVNSIKEQADDIETSLRQAGIAITTAEEVREIALQQGREASLVASYVDPNGVLSAAVDSADTTKAIITVMAHTRKYGDGSSVSVAGGTVSGLNLATIYYVYYNDPQQAGGTVTYFATDNPLDAGNGQGRHAVGDVPTPGTSTSPPSEGGGSFPPGVQCPTVETMILMADAFCSGPGVEVEAGSIRAGDFVWTQHETTMEWGAYPVEAIRLLERPIMQADGYPDATAEHPFWINGEWVLMRELGQPAGRATIAHMTITDAHTFVARHPGHESGKLSHNKRQQEYPTDTP